MIVFVPDSKFLKSEQYWKIENIPIECSILLITDLDKWVTITSIRRAFYWISSCGVPNLEAIPTTKSIIARNVIIVILYNVKLTWYTSCGSVFKLVNIVHLNSLFCRSYLNSLHSDHIAILLNVCYSNVCAQKCLRCRLWGEGSAFVSIRWKVELSAYELVGAANNCRSELFEPFSVTFLAASTDNIRWIWMSSEKILQEEHECALKHNRQTDRQTVRTIVDPGQLGIGESYSHMNRWKWKWNFEIFGIRTWNRFEWLKSENIVLILCGCEKYIDQLSRKVYAISRWAIFGIHASWYSTFNLLSVIPVAVVPLLTIVIYSREYGND